MPSASAFLDEPMAPPSASAFLDEAPAVADTGEGGGFLAKINRALGVQDYHEPLPEVPGEEHPQTPQWAKAPEAAVSELVGGMVPHDLESYAAGIFPPLAAFEQGKQLAQGDVSSIPLVGRIPEIAAADETPAFSKERYLTAMKTLMDVGLLAGAGGERPSPLRTEPLAPEAPPTQSMGPGTIAGDVSRALQRSEFERRFTMQEPPPEPPPELAPSIPIEQTLPNIREPLPFNPEGGPLPQPESPISPRTEFGRLPGGADLQLSPPPPPIGTPLKGTPLVGLNGETPAADQVAAHTDPLPVPPESPVQAPGGPQNAPLPPNGVPVADMPYTQEGAAQRTTEPVGGNVAGFEKVYGPGEIPAGETVSPEDAWDTAVERAATGKAKPYGFVDRAKTGEITPEEMGDLIYEHHRLVERAAGMEGTPEYDGAAQAAKDFASNVLKPAETAWHRKGMVMQIERPVNLNTFTGMDQLMQTELGRGIKPSEAPKFTKMAEDVKNGETEVAKAVERADAKVRARYAKVSDIPIEEAVVRVKQMLKDCM